MADDVTDPLSTGSARWIGNHTDLNITVLVPTIISNVVITPPTFLTAGSNFLLEDKLRMQTIQKFLWSS